MHVKNPKISVVIPVYNVEKYLEECLDSVISQTLKDIEIICVNDGSTDNSLEILKEYASKDNRITVITQKNQGAGTARNSGLAIARGEYIHFLDGDDIVFEDFYKKTYNILTQKTFPNIVEFRCKSFDNETGKKTYVAGFELKNIPQELIGKFIDINENLDSILSLNVTPWSSLYKREFLINNKILFNSLKCCNDRSFHLESIIKAERVFLADLYGVNYRTNMKTSLRGVRDKYFDCHFKSINLITKICEEENLSKNIKKKILLSELADLIYHYNCNIAKSKYSDQIYKHTAKFLKKLDIKSLEPELQTKWYYKTFSNLYNAPYLSIILPKNRFLTCGYNETHNIYKIFGIKLKLRRRHA